uniref:Myotubularin- protein 8 n=1 Tax=Sphaerodactylus townsendi TaxID=933632 RepID=A0ACB8FWR4_9SAUR
MMVLEQLKDSEARWDAGGFPYFYKENNAAICRCSQPLSGFSARCLEDEQLLQAIREANPGSPFMYVVDTRPKLNAMA